MKKAFVLETVIYRLKPEGQSELANIHANVNEAVAKFPGFISRETHVSSSDSNVLIDYVKWESLAQAKAAMRAAETMPEMGAFFGAIEEVLFMDHFELLAA